MSGKRVTKIPRKFADCQDLEVQMAGRTAPYVKVKFVDDGQLEMYDSALISNEIIHPDTDESIRFEDLYVGQEVAALWRKTKHYVATVVELFQGEKSKDKKTVKPAPKTSKAKVTVKTAKKTLIKDSEGTAESSEEACLIDVEVKKKKKEIQAEKKKEKEAIMAANQQVAASLFKNRMHETNSVSTTVITCASSYSEPTNLSSADSQCSTRSAFESKILSSAVSSSALCFDTEPKTLTSSDAQVATVFSTPESYTRLTTVSSTASESCSQLKTVSSASGFNTHLSTASTSSYDFNTGSVTLSAASHTLPSILSQVSATPSFACSSSSYSMQQACSTAYSDFTHPSSSPFTQSMQYPFPVYPQPVYRPVWMQPYSIPNYGPCTDSHQFNEKIGDLDKSQNELLDIGTSTPGNESSFLTSSLNVIDGAVDIERTSTPISRSSTPSFIPNSTSSIQDPPHKSHINPECVDCAIKDKVIKDLKAEIDKLKHDLNESTLEPSTSQQKKRKYQPKTRPDIQMADYIDIGPNGAVPENFQVLAPGAPIAVKTLWLHNLLSTLSKQRAKKDKKAEKKGTVVREERGVEVLKRLMDGFFDPCDLAVEGGTKRFIDNPVFKSLQLYATHYLNMSVPSFKKHWNAKMVSSRQTLKRFKKQEEEA